MEGRCTVLSRHNVIAGRVIVELSAACVNPSSSLSPSGCCRFSARYAPTISSPSDAGIVAVRADPAGLQQIVWNLLSNSVKFTTRDDVVSLNVARRNQAIHITVADTGAGIDPELLPFVFDRFRQGDVGHSKSHGGLGLCLAIVRNLVELVGGTVSACSDGEGRGATFEVVLPAS